VDPWVIGIVEAEVEGLASDLQMRHSLEREIDLGLGQVTVLELGLAMARVQVRAIDHVAQRVAILSACRPVMQADLPRSMQNPGAERSLTWSDGPRRSVGPHSPLRNGVLGYLGNL